MKSSHITCQIVLEKANTARVQRWKQDGDFKEEMELEFNTEIHPSAKRAEKRPLLCIPGGNDAKWKGPRSQGASLGNRNRWFWHSEISEVAGLHFDF